MGALAQFRLLLWKSVRTAFRSKIWTLFETLQRPPPPDEKRFKGSSEYSQIELIDRKSISESKWPKRIEYWCDNSTCAETKQSFKQFCQKYYCNATIANYNPDANFRKFNRTNLDVSIYGTYLTSGSPERRIQGSSEEFNFVSRNGYGYGPFSTALTFARDAADLSMLIFHHEWGMPDAQSIKIPATLKFQFLVIIVSLVPMLSAINVTREISAERESNMKEYLLVMGMSRSVYYSHHLEFALLKALPATIAVSVLIIIDQPYIGFHFLLVYLLFVGEQISLSALISSIIKKPNIATITAFVVIPFTSTLAMLFPVLRTDTPWSFLVCFNPGHAISLAIDALIEGCYRDNTVYWFNDFKYALPFGPIVLIMAYDKEAHEDDLLLNIHEVDPALANAKVDIELINVHKTWPSGERAVRGVDVKLYRGQVTALLGHNGAGKSTTFAMIAGMVVPSMGTIKIGDADAKRAHSERKSLVGFCPQYNPIFPKLTVNEHLDFFARLKGVTDWREEGARLLELLLLKDKANTLSSDLSGGMKRKLCIAMALIGNSRVVLLDELTAGVDTGARRDIERLLIQQKKERTFLLTTHYTDEAENLGDRVLIMAGGKVVCSGSPSFLNRKFGAGYVLSCVSVDSKRLHAIADETLELVRCHISNCKAERQHGQQFEIWLDKEECDNFPDLFRSLEDHHITIGIESYGLSMNTLEQVFLRVGEMTGAKNREAEVNQALGVLLKENSNKGSRLGGIGNRFLYLQYKRLIYELINYKSFIFCFLPVIAIIFAASRLSSLNSNSQNDSDAVDMLLFPKCARIGIEKSTNLIDRFKAALPPKSDCIVIEEINNANDWFEQTAMVRRPLILAAFARNNTAGGIVVHRPSNQYIALPALVITLIKAMSNQSFNIKMDNRPTPDFDSPGDGSGVNLEMNAFAIFPLMIVFPMMIYRAIGFYVVERSVKFGHQQFLTGLSKFLYWFASFVSDCWTFAVYYIGMIVCCLIFGVIKERLLELTPLFLLCACVSLMKIYIIQRTFTSKIKAENFASLILLVEYLACAVVYMINLISFKKKDKLFTFEIQFDYPYLLDPNVTVMAYILSFIPQASTAYIILLAQLSLFFLIFFFLECGPIMRGIERCFTPGLPKGVGMNSDSSLQSTVPNDHLVNNLVKRYGSKKFAVRGISFGVTEHECFGLLGVNGAGKTSTFEVLTGNCRATAGTATVAGVDCAAPARIGYCPQFDALMEEMSGRQNLLILAALHGYSNPAAVTDTVIECVGMTAHANKTSRSYSGGQRRKISVAGALLAQNSLIILDEPTAGIDPVTRRDIWSVICALRDSTKTAIVLTSHSMDEVEALCSRVAIMKAGLIAAQGSSQTLKSRYGNYYKLSFVVPSEDPDTVERAVKDVFRNATRLNGSTSSFNFEIPREPGMLWSEMFTSAIKVARILNARDYCLSQASLEDVFIAIASGDEKKK
ncbi:hypothetical protein PRIPAC_80702 [Pristionchus pacificus]|nr:hypothetical protein PRIPAC_80702 [Pristionchus pacificus]